MRILDTFDFTFGLMHTVEKSAEILTKVYACRSDKLQTITAENLRNVAKGFHVTLPEKFLFENGSPCKKGNTSALVKAFTEG